MATKLQSLKLGDGASSYQNEHLTELYTGNNELLTSLDVQNCSALAMTVDLSGCVGIETIKAKGSAVTGFTLPVGGKLKTLELPGTVTNLTIRDQAQFETLAMTGYTALTTLRVENTPNIPFEGIINGATNLNRVRMIGVSWTATSETTLQTSITKLKTCIGMDAAGNNTATAVVTGRVYVPSISAALLTDINDAFPNLIVVANNVPQYIVRYLDWDNTVLYRAVVAEGADAVNAVTAGYITAPTKGGTDDTHYAFKDFGTLPTNIHKNETVIAQYTTTYRVRFMNGDVAFDTQWVAAGGSATTPTGTPTKASTAQYSYTFSSWSGSYTNITAPVDITATFTSTIRKYTVRFYNGTTLLQTVNDVPYGGTATFTGTTPVDPSGDGGEFEGWVPSNVGITGNTDCKAQFESALEVAEISDSWDEILASVANGTYKQKYKVGNYKPLDLGSEGIVNMQIAGIEKDDLADGSGKAPITWISKELLSTSKRMNPKRATEEGTGGIGGWEKCELRAYLIGTIMPLIPESVRSEIKIVSKTQNAYNISESSFSQTTQDAVWIPNYVEVFRTTSPYKTLFQNQDANRVKSKVGVTTASNWWLRNTADVRCFMYVTTSGGNGTSNAEFNQGVSFGFCT